MEERSVNPSEVRIGWFPEMDRSEEIKPAKEVLQSSERFLYQQLPNIGAKVKMGLVSLISHREQSSGPVLQRDEDVLDQLNSMPLEQLSAYVKFEVATMEQSSAIVHQRRSKGFHKGAAKFQEFAMTFHRFLRAYSGIVEIVQTVDAQYGNVASAALSLLFVTVKLKAEAEASIYTCMRQISDRLPDLSVYRRIYPDPALGSMLAEAYRDVVVFARNVTIYHQGSGFARYVRHLGKTDDFQLMENGLRQQFDRIRLKCEVLLAQKIDFLVQENEEYHQQNNMVLVMAMRKTLELGDYRTEDLRDEVKNYCNILKHHFNNDRKRQKMDLQSFLATTSGQDWEGPDSMLLLLYGRNEQSVSTQHSWLSLVPVELIEVLLNSNGPVAYELCRRSGTLELGMSHLIFQLLERNPGLIKRADDFKAIESQVSSDRDSTKRKSALRTALLRLIDLHDRQVFIVLDRPDICAGSCAEYITTMLSLVKDAKTKLKIMIVLGNEFWDAERYWREIDGQGLGPDRFRRVRMDQRIQRMDNAQDAISRALSN